MGLPMTLGRGFAKAEEQLGNERVVVLSHGFWTTHFGAERSVLGRSITLDGVPYTVVGVANPYIEYPPAGDYWIPATFDYDREFRDFRYLGVIGRVRDGVSLADAQTELAQISEAIALENSETNAGWSAEVLGLKETQVAGVRPILLGMTVAVGLLLVIAVGNVTNLAIGRSTDRQTDIAVRRALGASNTAITGLCVTESLVIAMLGSALGVLLAVWGTTALSTVALRSMPHTSSISVDAYAITFALCTAALVGLVLGLLSVVTSGSNNLGQTLRAGARGSGSNARAHRVREGVLTAQVGMALALLIGATLLAQSLYNLSRIDVGFSPKNVLTFSYDLPGSWDRDAATLRSFYLDALEQISGVPGVQAAAAVTPIPMEMGSVPSSWSLPREVAGTADPTVMAHMRTVTPEYFAAMGISLLSGREFTYDDRDDSEQVALVNRAFVDRYLGGSSALGLRINPGDEDAAESDWSTIVGVVEDVRFRSLTTEPEPEIYIPMQQFPSGWGHLVVRADVHRDVLARAVTDAVQQVEPDLALANVKSGEEIIAEQSRVSRISTTLTSLFAFMATVLAAVGIIGMLSIVIAQRTREIGLRVALGAAPGSIWRIVLLRGMRPVLFGLALGLAISLTTTRFLESQIHNVSTLDPLAFLLPTIAFTILGLLACVVPSLKASRVDPVGLLRAE
jgi:predicted permease